MKYSKNIVYRIGKCSFFEFHGDGGYELKNKFIADSTVVTSK